MNFNEHIKRELPNEYGGSEKKRTVILDDGNKYLLKFPDPTRELHREVSYINNSISEYLGCKIAESMGLPVQKVLIGEYFDQRTGKTKIACACMDVRTPGVTMHPVDMLELGSLEQQKNNASFEIADSAIEALGMDESQTDEFKQFYRKQFILDTLLCNKDRHNGNWAVLFDGENYLPCPVYDCGSSLFPLLSDRELAAHNTKSLILGASSALENPDGSKINYHEYWTKGNTDELLKKELLLTIGDISLEKINGIIDRCPYISDERRDKYKEFIQCSYEQILIPALEKILCVPQKDVSLSPKDLYDYYTSMVKPLKNLEMFNICPAEIDGQVYSVMRISNSKALMFTEDGICQAVLPIRSNNNEVREFVNIMEFIKEQELQIEKEELLQEISEDDLEPEI